MEKKAGKLAGRNYPYVVIEEVDADRVNPPAGIVAWYEWKDYKMPMLEWKRCQMLS